MGIQFHYLQTENQSKQVLNNVEVLLRGHLQMLIGKGF